MELEIAAVWAPIDSIRPWPKNPRKVTAARIDRIARSIEEFGWGSPIIVRRANGEIIAGEGRWRAARKRGDERVPVRYLDVTEEQAHRLALVDNRSTELTDWDDDLLVEALQDVSIEDAGFLGWDETQLTTLGLFDGAEDEQVDDANDDVVPEPPKVPITKRGDVWILGDHRIVCGDCRDADDVALLIGDQRATIAMTSPPYASQRKYDESSGFRPIAPDSFVDWFELVQANVRSALVADGSWFVNIKEHAEDGARHLYVKDLTIAHVRRWRWRFVDELAWVHAGFPGKMSGRFKNAWEPVFHFAAGWPIAKFHPERNGEHSDNVPVRAKGDPGREYDHGNIGVPDRRRSGVALPSNVIRPGRETVANHAAAFPVGLPAFFIRAYTDAGDVVFDPFMGSGTTLIACEKEGRAARGIEISPAYCDVIVERWESRTGARAKRISGGE